MSEPTLRLYIVQSAYGPTTAYRGVRPEVPLGTFVAVLCRPVEPVSGFCWVVHVAGRLHV